MKNVSKWGLAGALSLLLLAGGAHAAHAQEGDQTFALGSGRVVRGSVTAVAPEHLTIKTDAGEVYQVALTPNTQIHKGRELAKAADIHPGDGVGAMGEIDAPNKTVHALYLFLVDAEQMKKAREAMGKTYIAGRITAIDDLKITVLRPDGVSQTIAVDEDTSFKRGGRGMSNIMGGGTVAGNRQAPPGGPGSGESITLADIKVGDTIAGQGALKGGIFVPTQLYIGDPASGGRRRGTAAGNPGLLGPSGQNNGEPKQ